jgi:hypothetical protein
MCKSWGLRLEPWTTFCRCFQGHPEIVVSHGKTKKLMDQQNCGFGFVKEVIVDGQ